MWVYVAECVYRWTPFSSCRYTIHHAHLFLKVGTMLLTSFTYYFPLRSERHATVVFVKTDPKETAQNSQRNKWFPPSEWYPIEPSCVGNTEVKRKGKCMLYCMGKRCLGVDDFAQSLLPSQNKTEMTHPQTKTKRDLLQYRFEGKKIPQYSLTKH